MNQNQKTLLISEFENEFMQFVGSSGVLVYQEYSDKNSEERKKSSQWCKEHIRGRLEAHGEFRASMTHSGGLAVGVGRLGTTGVGVDLERADRVVSDGVWERLVSPGERVEDLGRLQVWCIKEACFKAHPRSQGTFVSQYAVQSWDSARCEGQVCGPFDVRFNFRVLHSAEWCLVFALEAAIG